MRRPADLIVVPDGGTGASAPAVSLLQGFDTATQIIRVGPADLPFPSPGEHRKLLRDALRLTLWRATGSTGAWLSPEVVARKRAVCGV